MSSEPCTSAGGPCIPALFGACTRSSLWLARRRPPYAPLASCPAAPPSPFTPAAPVGTRPAPWGRAWCRGWGSLQSQSPKARCQSCARWRRHRRLQGGRLHIGLPAGAPMPAQRAAAAQATIAGGDMNNVIQTIEHSLPLTCTCPQRLSLAAQSAPQAHCGGRTWARALIPRKRHACTPWPSFTMLSSRRLAGMSPWNPCH